MAQLWRTTIRGCFSPKVVLWLWCSLSENCGRGWGCGGKNLKIVVVVEVGGGSILEKLCCCCGCGVHFSKNLVVVAFF